MFQLFFFLRSNDDRIFVVYNNGLSLISEAFTVLHLMHHEATACHVTSELTDLVNIFTGLVKALRQSVAGGRSQSPKRGEGSSGESARQEARSRSPVAENVLAR